MNSKLIGAIVLLLVLVGAAATFYITGKQTIAKRDKPASELTTLLSSSMLKLDLVEEASLQSCIDRLKPLGDTWKAEEVEPLRSSLRECFKTAFGEEYAQYCVDAIFDAQYAKRELPAENPFLVGLSVIGIKTSGAQHYESAVSNIEKCSSAIQKISPPSLE